MQVTLIALKMLLDKGFIFHCQHAAARVRETETAKTWQGHWRHDQQCVCVWGGQAEADGDRADFEPDRRKRGNLPLDLRGTQTLLALQLSRQTTIQNTRHRQDMIHSNHFILLLIMQFCLTDIKKICKY